MKPAMLSRRLFSLSALASLPALFLPRSWARASTVRPRMMSDVIDGGDPAEIAQTVAATAKSEAAVGRVYHKNAEWMASSYINRDGVEIHWFTAIVAPRGYLVPLASSIPAPPSAGL